MTRTHGAFYEDYNELVPAMLKARGNEDEAYLAAVGGPETVGDVEFTVLARYGLREGAYLIDVGCGSGRLARRVARMSEVRYLGTDVVQDLLDYARRTSGRQDFRFDHVTGLSIPEREGVADLVCFFSVGTHLLHEEFYLYLADAKRVLKPGGCIVFSFLDMQTTHGRQTFIDMVRSIHRGGKLPHLNTFTGRADIYVWAELLGMKVVDVRSGDEPCTSPEILAPQLSAPVRNAPTHQSVAVLRK